MSNSRSAHRSRGTRITPNAVHSYWQDIVRRENFLASGIIGRPNTRGAVPLVAYMKTTTSPKHRTESAVPCERKPRNRRLKLSRILAPTSGYP
jgi:hypothetical protein